jgi:hypothetical protein
MTDEEIIWVITDDVSQISVPDGSRGGSGTGGSWADEVQAETPGTKGLVRGVPVRVQELEQNMGSFLQVVQRLFRQAEQQADGSSGMQLNEVELSVEISGNGEIKLIATAGVKTEAKGAIKLKFKRSNG